MKHYDVLICGGGAAGFFTAINLAEMNPSLKIAILERGKTVLEKVRISGGGRCNVMHACYDPNQLIKFYPRGEKELRGPFHSFSSADTEAWFERHGVSLKTEDDGRMFPVSNTSQTIIDCFLGAATRLKIDILTGQSVQRLHHANDAWRIDTTTEQFICQAVVMATGSNPKMWELLRSLGHSVVEPVPSLFTFNIKDKRIADLPGIAAPATVKVEGTRLAASGPVLITHWGMSGPAILRLSAWGARILAEKQYRFRIVVNWLDGRTIDEALAWLQSIKMEHARKNIGGKSPLPMPNRLWDNLVAAAGITGEKKWADLSRAELNRFATELAAGVFEVNGKSTFKEEFVTAGGIDLREVNFKTMESKLQPHLYFAGEILNIDAITGGFNFQNAWTGGFLAAQAAAAH